MTFDQGEIKKLKFKYGEYLIGDKKSFYDLKSYVEDKFTLEETSPTDSRFQLMNRFLRQNFCHSYKNINHRYREEELDLTYFIIKKDDLSHKYYSKANPNTYPLYIVFEERTKNFDTNSPILAYELAIYQGVSEWDIKNDSEDLANYLSLLDHQAMMETLKDINPEFITPEDKRRMLETYLMNRLNELKP